MNTTTYPGGSENSESRDTFSEKIEKDISNIICRNTQPWIGSAIDDPKWQVTDRNNLIYEILEYITKK